MSRRDWMIAGAVGGSILVLVVSVLVAGLLLVQSEPPPVDNFITITEVKRKYSNQVQFAKEWEGRTIIVKGDMHQIKKTVAGYELTMRDTTFPCYDIIFNFAGDEVEKMLQVRQGKHLVVSGDVRVTQVYCYIDNSKILSVADK